MAETSRPRLCTKETVKREGLNIWVDDEEVPSKTKIDIILVQGLGAHPYYTWVGRDETQSKNTSSNSPLSKLKGRFGRDKAQKKTSGSSEKAPEQSFFWPKELLPNYISPARIATYSYESKWWDKNFRTNLRTCGEQLLAVLHQHRQQASIRGRPIIFIGHSLGGLVAQQALVLASMNDMYIDIQSSVAGALFLGAPMQGANSIKYISLYTNAAGNEQPMMTALAAGSDELFALANDFRARYKTLSMTFFYEQHDSRYGGVVSILAVDMQSSTMIGLQKLYLPADHSHLNKFWGESDEKFQLFIPSVTTMSDEIYRKMEEARKKEIESQMPREETPSKNRILPERTQATNQVPAQGKIMIPFTRDKGFVGRADILQEIDEMLHFSEEQTRVALVGLGGIGKSQIAIEYAYRFRARFPDAMILWVYGTNATRFRASYTDIAKQLRLKGLNDPQDDPLDVLRRWLQSEESGRWFMILDNVDDRSFVTPNPESEDTSKNEFSIPEFLPQRENSVVLLTSRDGEAALDLINQDSRFKVTVQSMNKEDTRLLLDKKLPKSNAKEEDKECLIEKLDSIPLAITQAAAYLHKKTRVTLKQYLVLLDKSEHDPKSVLNIHGSDSRRDPKVTNAVFKTWQITLNVIKENHPDAAELLAVMSMFDRQGIPAFLFQNEHEAQESDSDGDESSEAVGDEDESEQDDDNDSVSSETSDPSDANSTASATSSVSSKFWFTEFEESIQILLSFCLLTEEENGSSFQMHRLVQLATTNWLGASESIQRHKDKAMRVLAKAYPDGDEFENWVTCRALEPHTEALLGSKYSTRKCRLARARLCEHKGSFLVQQGAFSKAEKLLTVAVQELTELLGEDHEHSLWPTMRLGVLYLRQSRYEMAEKHNLKYLAIAEDTYGKNDELSLAFHHTLNNIYIDQGHYEKAVEGCEKLLAMTTQVLGEHHRDTGLDSSNLARVYVELERSKEAIDILLPLSERRIKNYGKEHPDTMNVLQELARAYKMQGRLQEAEELELDILQVSEKSLGGEHPDTLLSKTNLAATIFLQGRLPEAEMLEIGVLRSRTRIHGEAHVETLLAMSNLSDTYKKQGKYSEAIPLRIKAVRLSEKVLKSTHPKTKKRTRWLQEDLSKLHAKGDQESQDLIIQAQEQMEAAIEISHSTCLAKCLYHVYFLRCLQLKNSKDQTSSAEDQEVVKTDMEKLVVSALRLFVEDDYPNGEQRRNVGKVLALAGRERDASTFFERIIVQVQATSEQLEGHGSHSSDGSGYDSEDIEKSNEDLDGEVDDKVDTGYKEGDEEEQVVRDDEVEVGTTGNGTAVGSEGDLHEGTVETEKPQTALSEVERELAWQDRCTPSGEVGHHAGIDGSGSDDFKVTLSEEQEKYADRPTNLGSEDGIESIKLASEQDIKQDNEIAEESEEEDDDGTEAIQRKAGIWDDNSWCAGCEDPMGPLQTRHFCLECDYTDLCQNCFDLFQQEGRLDSDEMKDCRCHSFLSAPRSEWYNLSWGEVSEDGTTFTEWVDNLLIELQSRDT